MARKVKCPTCGTLNDKENTISHSSKYYCKDCYDSKIKETQNYKELITYICELYQIEAPTGWILKQIKDFKEQFNYSYKGIGTTLRYFFEIKEGNDVADSMGIGIVPFVYDEAYKFYVDKKAIKDSVVNFNLEEIEANKKVITIKRNADEVNKFKEIALIDIGKL